MIAEGLFCYFPAAEVERILRAAAARLGGGEVVFDALSRRSVRIHNRSSGVLRDAGARLEWGLDDPRSIEAWGLGLIETWGYFDAWEPRLGAANLIRFIPPLARANRVLRYSLGGGARG